MNEGSLTPASPTRRIVTGHDDNGRALVTMDGPASNHKSTSGGGVVSTLLWSTHETPAEIWTGEDFGARIVATQPPPMGSRFCVIEFPPGAPGRMHRTDTVDYVVCLAGGIDMEMDDGLIVHMDPGDTMVQQGTNHAWLNRGSELAKVAFVLIDGKPSADGTLRGPGPQPPVAAPDLPDHLAPPEPPIRRIVTTHDADGKALVMTDGVATNHKSSSGRGNVSTLLWSTDETPAEIWRAEDYGARILGTQPPPMGSRFCIIDYPPGTPGRMHRTDTVDFIVCLAGGIDMELDDGATVHMDPGDTMVQQGTNHSWINNGTGTCRLAIALLDARPKG